MKERSTIRSRGALNRWIVASFLGVGLLASGGGCGAPSATPSRLGADDGLSLEEEGPASSERHPATELVARGEKHLIAEDAGLAHEAFEAALKENPNDPRALLDLGLVLEMQGEKARAESMYRRALERDPEFPQALNNLGLLLRTQGRLPEAIRSFERALEEDGRFVEAQVNLALTLEQQGELGGARVAYARAIELLPRDALVRANYGQLLLEFGERGEAEVELRRALSLAEEDPAVLLTIGNGLRRAGASEPAVRAMRRAIAARKEGPTPALLAELSLAERAAGDREASEKTLEQALKLDPRYALAHYLVAGLLASRGAYRDAAKHYERYLALEPRGPHATKAKQHLSEVRRASR